jgi:8-oxo-dGTP diphosphatase
MADPLQIISVIIIIRSKKKFLLVKRALNDDIFPGKWQNLGGKVEIGERIEKAIVREIQEEIGVSIPETIPPRFVLSYSWQKDLDSPYRLGVVFEMLVPSTKLSVTLDTELADWGWFSMEEIEKMDTIGPDRPRGTIGQLRASLN